MVPINSNDNPNQQWIIIVVSIATTVSLVTGLLYCMLCRKLMQKFTTWRMKSSAKGSTHKGIKVPTMSVTPEGKSPATSATKQTYAVQPSTSSSHAGGKSSPKHQTKKGTAHTAHKSGYLGRIQLHLEYYPSRMVLAVTVINGKDLAARDISGYSDPYCRLMLLPECDKKLSTKVIKKTLNPLWNQTLQFHVSKAELKNQTLHVYVLDHDILNSDDFIGEMCIYLHNLDMSRGKTMWRELQPCHGYATRLGELLLSLCYMPALERLIINILKARHLPPMDLNHFSDPYVKVWRIYDGKKQEKRRTQIVMKNLNPVFNESFSFNIPADMLSSTQLLVTVKDYDKITANDLIGHVLLGPTSGGIEVKQWKDMLDSPQQSVAQWHVLQKNVPYQY